MYVVVWDATKFEGLSGKGLDEVSCVTGLSPNPCNFVLSKKTSCRLFSFHEPSLVLDALRSIDVYVYVDNGSDRSLCPPSTNVSSFLPMNPRPGSQHMWQYQTGDSLKGHLCSC